MKYYEVFGGNGYHSAFMTTYAFSARAFEDVPLPRLRGAGCRNITVLADRGMLNTSFEEFDPPRYAGTLYHVVKATMPGAFHSKITLLVGAERGRLLIGSANLTALGLGGNRELIADVHHTPEMREFAPLFGQIMHYIESHVPEDDPWFVSARDRALQDASWLRTAIREDATPLPDLRLVFDRPEDTILDQVTAAIGSDMIERLIVLSPYWDVGLDGLRQLRSAIGTPATDLLLQPSAGLFPVDSLDGNDDLHLFDIDATDSTRFVHAKLFVALGEAWDHVISGSMNCSVPALLGPEVPHGNAEAGVYRRVPRGEALAALGLEGYRDRPVEIAELPEFQKRERTMPERTVPADAGNFELRGVELFWRPPRYSNLSPVEIRLFNRDHEELPQVLHIDDSSSNKWMIDPELDRPRVACIIGGDGTWSTPTSIVDLEVLSISTRPRQRGRKRILIDSLDDRYPEDLTLLEVFNELEALTVSERNRSRVSAPTRGTAVAQMDSEPTYRVLPYEAFVAARNRARPEHGGPLPWLRTRDDGPAGIMNSYLNRLVGLVSEDFAAQEERVLLKDEEIDFGTMEPSGDAEPNKIEKVHGGSVGRPAHRDRSPATPQKYLQAVKAFEIRAATLKDKRIRTVELVRLRALLQIVLAGAMPVSGKARYHQVLPLKARDSTEWPRLIGRLLRQHFGTNRVLQSRDVEEEGEHVHVLDYLVTARFAAHMAVRGAQASRSLAPIREALGALAADLDTRTQITASACNADELRMAELGEKLRLRFARPLGLGQDPTSTT